MAVCPLTCAGCSRSSEWENRPPAEEVGRGCRAAELGSRVRRSWLSVPLVLYSHRPAMFLCLSYWPESMVDGRRRVRSVVLAESRVWIGVFEVPTRGHHEVRCGDSVSMELVRQFINESRGELKYIV